VITYNPPPGLEAYHFKDGGLWYKRAGKSIRSVSKILERIYPMPPDLDPWYLERGKAVHSATVFIDEGRLGEVDHRIIPFCSAYQEFLRIAHPIMEACELSVVHPSYKFGARIDRVMRLPGQEKLVVVDIKCGEGKEDRYWLQVAACAMALDEPNLERYDLALLNLTSKGRARITFADHPGEWVNRWRRVLEEDVA
jgi:hypothetical protein